LFRLLRVDLPVSDPTTLSRRCTTLSLCRTARHNEVKADSGPIHVLIDSTGLKIYGAGKWCEDKHGCKSPRLWRKLHLAVDADTGEIIAEVLTDQNTSDISQLAALLEQIAEPIASSQQMEPMTVTGHTKPCGAIALVPVLSLHRACGNLRTHIMAHRISVTGTVMLMQNMAG